MNKGAILIIIGVILILLSLVSGVVAFIVPASMIESANEDDFDQSGNIDESVYTYTFKNIGPGDLDVRVDPDIWATSYLYGYWTVNVTGESSGLLKSDSGSNIDIEITLSKAEDITITVTGSPDPDIYASFTGENFNMICYGGCMGFIILLIIGIILIIVGIIMAVKSKPKKPKGPPQPPAYMQPQYPQQPPQQPQYQQYPQQPQYQQQRPQTLGSPAGQNPYYGQPAQPGQYPQYPPPQGQQPGYPPPY
jgi:uncharacterized membrane protein